MSRRKTRRHRTKVQEVMYMKRVVSHVNEKETGCSVLAAACADALDPIDVYEPIDEDNGEMEDGPEQQ